MKCTRILRTLVAALSLALLATAMATTPALAEENLRVSPDKAKIGDSFEVFGSGFGVASPYDIYFSHESATVGQKIATDVINYQLLGRVATNAYGTFENYYFSVPDRLIHGSKVEEVRGGTYYLYATTGFDKVIKAKTGFTVEMVAKITLGTEEGAVGTEVEVSGKGFTSEEGITIKYDDQAVDIKSGSNKADTNGEFEFTTIIPKSTSGEHTITVAGDKSNAKAQSKFTVKAQITVTPESGTAGDTITVTGTGFGNKVDVTVTFDDEVVTGGTTDKNGSFTVSFTARSRTEGSHSIDAWDGDGNLSNKASFTMAACAISLSQTTGYVGDEVRVNGVGFQVNRRITITFHNKNVATTASDGYGKFNVSFNIPAHPGDNYKVVASDGTEMQEADFKISTSASISQTTGYVGTTLTVSGAGSTAGRTVVITYDGNQVATAIASTNGTFSATFNAPASSGGNHTITVTDGTTTQSFTFVMESTPPSVPTPLKPEMGIEAKAKAYFDWEDVTDPSGVTYTLQIATSENFSEDSIVLERTGLTLSECTLAKAESLKSVNQETPYYWRVKAVDGASNESQWSGTGSFYVGFALTLSQPMIYALIGIGALLLAGFAFWLGRRTSYY